MSVSADNHENKQDTSQKEKRKNKITAFLERNEIWFKTVLSVALTTAALFVSMASCNNAQSQARLASITAAQDSREKNPFFSIEQYYDKEREQYIYGIVNTGGQIRQCRVVVNPYLVITQENRTEKNVSSSPLDERHADQKLNTAYIYLPEFYTAEDPSIFVNGVLAFSDIWMDSTVSHDFSEIGVISGDEFQEPELADRYFSDLVSCNNVDDLPTRMHSHIEYYVEIYYYNYENTSQKETLWLSRGADAVGKAAGATGNQFLYYSKLYGEPQQYTDAKMSNHTYIIDSLNLPLNDIASECKEIIAELFVEFNQLRNPVAP